MTSRSIRLFNSDGSLKLKPQHPSPFLIKQQPIRQHNDDNKNHRDIPKEHNTKNIVESMFCIPIHYLKTLNLTNENELKVFLELDQWATKIGFLTEEIKKTCLRLKKLDALNSILLEKTSKENFKKNSSLIPFQVSMKRSLQLQIQFLTMDLETAIMNIKKTVSKLEDCKQVNKIILTEHQVAGLTELVKRRSIIYELESILQKRLHYCFFNPSEAKDVSVNYIQCRSIEPNKRDHKIVNDLYLRTSWDKWFKEIAPKIKISENLQTLIQLTCNVSESAVQKEDIKTNKTQMNKIQEFVAANPMKKDPIKKNTEENVMETNSKKRKRVSYEPNNGQLNVCTDSSQFKKQKHNNDQNLKQSSLEIKSSTSDQSNSRKASKTRLESEVTAVANSNKENESFSANQETEKSNVFLTQKRFLFSSSNHHWSMK